MFHNLHEEGVRSLQLTLVESQAAEQNTPVLAEPSTESHSDQGIRG